MLTHISFIFFTYKPSLSLHIFKGHIQTRVSLVTSQNDREQKTTSYQNIFKFDVSDVDSRLCLASSFRIERIEHAARSSSVRLFLLLWAEINRPPYRLMHSDILVKDVINDSKSIFARISLDVDPFKRFLEKCISKGNISDTVDLCVRRHASDRETYSKSDSDVLN